MNEAIWPARATGMVHSGPASQGPGDATRLHVGISIPSNGHSAAAGPGDTLFVYFPVYAFPPKQVQPPAITKNQRPLINDDPVSHTRETSYPEQHGFPSLFSFFFCPHKLSELHQPNRKFSIAEGRVVIWSIAISGTFRHASHSRPAGPRSTPEHPQRPAPLSSGTTSPIANAHRQRTSARPLL